MNCFDAYIYDICGFFKCFSKKFLTIDMKYIYKKIMPFIFTLFKIRDFATNVNLGAFFAKRGNGIIRFIWNFNLPDNVG